MQYQPTKQDLSRAWSDLKGRGCERAREWLIGEYLHLVSKTRQRVAPRIPTKIDPQDLEADGMIALIRAVDAFDPGRAVKFESYAISMVRGAMLEHLREGDWAPRSVRTAQKRILAAEVALTQRGDDPTAEALAVELGLSLDAFHALRGYAETLRVVSLEDATGEHQHDEFDDLFIADQLADSAPAPDVVAERRTLAATLSRLVSHLSPERAETLRRYYWGGETLKAIAKTTGVSESRAHQRHFEGLASLRKWAADSLPIEADGRAGARALRARRPSAEEPAAAPAPTPRQGTIDTAPSLLAAYAALTGPPPRAVELDTEYTAPAELAAPRKEAVPVATTTNGQSPAELTLRDNEILAAVREMELDLSVELPSASLRTLEERFGLASKTVSLSLIRIRGALGIRAKIDPAVRAVRAAAVSAARAAETREILLAALEIHGVEFGAAMAAPRWREIATDSGRSAVCLKNTYAAMCQERGLPPPSRAATCLATAKGLREARGGAAPGQGAWPVPPAPAAVFQAPEEVASDFQVPEEITPEELVRFTAIELGIADHAGHVGWVVKEDRKRLASETGLTHAVIERVLAGMRNGNGAGSASAVTVTEPPLTPPPVAPEPARVQPPADLASRLSALRVGIAEGLLEVSPALGASERVGVLRLAARLVEVWE